MRILNAAVGAVLLILVASPAFAGDPRGGGRPGGGQHGGGACGSGCGGGGHPTPPPPPPSHGCGGGGCGGGYGGNINVNVNANANANAYAGASATSHFNARAYDVGGIRGRGYGGGTVYVGGGYGGDGGGYYGGGAVYNEEVYTGRTCASAPFGYVVGGFGREGRRPPACVGGGATCRGDDRGGRYGYSERRGCDGGRREEEYGGYAQSGGSYESYESYEDYEAWSGGYGEEAYGYEDRGGSYGRDCGCRRDDHAGAPYPPPYLPEPPRHYEPAPRPHHPERPRPSRPPRQHYSQEPGERG